MNARDKIKTYGALAAFIVVLGVAGKVDSAEPATPSAVELSDARRAPSVLRLVQPFQRARIGRTPCGSYRFTDTSAYRWNGEALGAQRSVVTDRGRFSIWPAKHGSVDWNGRAFYNGTRQPVIVAGWCDV